MEMKTYWVLKKMLSPQIQRLKCIGYIMFTLKIAIQEGKTWIVDFWMFIGSHWILGPKKTYFQILKAFIMVT